MSKEKFMSEKKPQPQPQIYSPETDPIELARRKKEIEDNYAERALSTDANIMITLRKLRGMSNLDEMTESDIERAVEDLNEMGKQAREIEREMTPMDQVRMRHGEIVKLLSGKHSIWDVQNAYSAAQLGILAIEEARQNPEADHKALDKECEFFNNMIIWLSGLHGKDLKK